MGKDLGRGMVKDMVKDAKNMVKDMNQDTLRHRHRGQDVDEHDDGGTGQCGRRSWRHYIGTRVTEGMEGSTEGIAQGNTEAQGAVSRTRSARRTRSGRSTRSGRRTRSGEASGIWHDQNARRPGETGSGDLLPEVEVRFALPASQRGGEGIDVWVRC